MTSINNVVSKVKKSRKFIFFGVLSIVCLCFILILGDSLFETNMAGYVQVKQAAVTGTLSCKLEPGMYWQGFGDIHTYAEASTFFFTVDKETGEPIDQSLPTRFNDGTQAKISGSVRILLPQTDCEKLISVHRKFKSMRGVMNKLVRPAVRKALFSTGSHMSAAESYAERRGEFAALVEDQLINGSIKTDKQKTEKSDVITGKLKVVWETRKITCTEEDGLYCVAGYSRDIAAFQQFSITVTNFVVDAINYPGPVIAQIERQRKARMDIITQQAEAKQAEARASKAKAEAEAAIAETRATEEVAKTQRIVKAEADKAEAVLNAQKKKEVAALEKDAAEFEKKKLILQGEGEATKKRLVMQADGALEMKLRTLEVINKNYAQALASASPGALVPYISMGSSGKSGSANDLIQLLTARTAKQLSIDMSVRGAKATP